MMKLDVPDARTAAPSLSRMRLHHRGCTAGICARSRATSSAATRAATERRPRRTAGTISGARQLRGLRRGDRRPARGRRGDRRAAALSSRPDAAGAGGRQARARREARVPADGRLPHGARGEGPGRARRARRRERSLQAAGGDAARAARRGRHRRDGVRALHDDRQAAQDGRRLAQRRSDGRRRRVLRGRDPLAAPGRQPRAEDHDDSRLPAVGVARGPRHAREEHDGGVPLRQRRGRVAVLLARDPVALQRPAAVEAVRARRHHHVRVERALRRWSGGTGLSAARVPGLPRHPRLSGDVSRLPPGDQDRTARRR